MRLWQAFRSIAGRWIVGSKISAGKALERWCCWEIVLLLRWDPLWLNEASYHVWWECCSYSDDFVGHQKVYFSEVDGISWSSMIFTVSKWDIGSIGSTERCRSFRSCRVPFQNLPRPVCYSLVYGGKIREDVKVAGLLTLTTCRMEALTALMKHGWEIPEENGHLGGNITSYCFFFRCHIWVP